MKPRRILIVDDEPAIRHALEKFLRRRGDVVLLAGSGEEACEILRSQTVDAILMDLRMPAMSGQTLFHAIASQWPQLLPRIAVMTGDPEAEEHYDWLKLHNLPILMKPFELERLSALVDLLAVEEPRRKANGE